MLVPRLTRKVEKVLVPVMQSESTWPMATMIQKSTVRRYEYQCTFLASSCCRPAWTASDSEKLSTASRWASSSSGGVVVPYSPCALDNAWPASGDGPVVVVAKAIVWYD